MRRANLLSAVSVSILGLVWLGEPATTAARGKTAARLVGMWKCKLGRKVMGLAILPNGRLGLETLSGRYRLVAGKLQVLQNMRWVSYPFRLKTHRKRRKDGLRITLPNKTSLKCTRLGRGKERQLRGLLCAWSGSSSSYAGTSYSRSTRVFFDGKGWFRFASETSFSSRSGLMHNKNKARIGMYRVLGKRIVVALPDGSMGLAKVHMKQRSGRITEVKYGGRLFAAGLCK